MVRVATRFLTFHGDITGVSYLSMIALDHDKICNLQSCKMCLRTRTVGAWMIDCIIISRRRDRRISARWFGREAKQSNSRAKAERFSYASGMRRAM